MEFCSKQLFKSNRIKPQKIIKVKLNTHLLQLRKESGIWTLTSAGDTGTALQSIKLAS